MLRGTAGQSCIRRNPSRLRRQSAAPVRRTALLPTLRAPCETASVDEVHGRVKEGANEVEDAFGANVDYAMLVKTYSGDEDSRECYSPSDIVSAVPIPVTGNPKPSLISTSHIERQNLTIRMQLRRFTRLTNAFSKKMSNLRAATALHFAHYNFCRNHSSLRVTPAMAAGISVSIWGIDRLLS
jgi:hypothetical protein